MWEKWIEHVSEEDLHRLYATLAERFNGDYGLVWEVQDEEMVHTLKTHGIALEEQQDKRIHTSDDLPNNLLIEGDNLAALTALQENYRGKCHIAIIDPPYNSGEDFIYNDDYVDKNNRYKHSKWLSFMANRLPLVKELLADNGVVFLSIDEMEIAQLKLLCHKIFGEQNHIATFIWHSKAGGAHNSRHVATETEYILAYAKNITKCKFNQVAVDTDTATYKLTDEHVDTRGRHLLNKLDRSSLRYYTCMDYVIMSPENTPIYAGGNAEKHEARHKGKHAPKDWGWRWSKDKLDEGIANGFIVFKKVKDEWRVYSKQYQYVDNNNQPQIRTVPYRNVIKDMKTIQGTQEIVDILGDRVFMYPKPKALIKYLIGIPQVGKDAIILDPFAGSGTTGHSVLELNQEDGGKRQFILCNNNEQNVCRSVTYPRLKKVVKGYSNKKGKNIPGVDGNVTYYKVVLTSANAEYDANGELK